MDELSRLVVSEQALRSLGSEATASVTVADEWAGGYRSQAVDGLLLSRTHKMWKFSSFRPKNVRSDLSLKCHNSVN